MTPDSMREYLAAHAPELEVVELPEAHTTEYISREWKVLPAQVAKTLTLRVGEDAIIVVTCGDSRLDNRKVKEELGGKGHMMPGSEASRLQVILWAQSRRSASVPYCPYSSTLG